MIHEHLTYCDSTQEEVKERLLKGADSTVLVSTNEQKLGRGQRANRWLNVDKSLLMSFNLDASPTLTLTSLEVGVLVCRFFKSEFDLELGLKWPNDIFFKGQKCGGILIQKTQFMICGIGINLSHSQNTLNEEFSFSTLNLTNINHQELSHKLCSYILSHRLSDKEIMDSFNLLCVHMNKYVEVSEDDKKFQGKFLEIGKHGEARILINNEVKNFYSARLLIHN